jgi:hypothetical protein
MLDRVKQISLKYVNEKMNELKEQFIEMGQLKSNFDIEKFGIKKQGNFIAHNFHFMMRQYSLALSAARTKLLDKEEKTRRLEEWKQFDRKEKVDGKYVDIEIARLENQIDMIDISVTNKLCMCEYYEKCRQALIQLNGGKPPTNEQYQKEEPEFWKWFAKRRALQQHKQAKTGIREGVWELIDNLETLPLINQDFMRVMGSAWDIRKIESELEIEKRIARRGQDEEFADDRIGDKSSRGVLYRRTRRD